MSESCAINMQLRPAPCHTRIGNVYGVD